MAHWEVGKTGNDRLKLGYYRHLHELHGPSSLALPCFPTFESQKRIGSLPVTTQIEPGFMA